MGRAPKQTKKERLEEKRNAQRKQREQKEEDPTVDLDSRIAKSKADLAVLRTYEFGFKQADKERELKEILDTLKNKRDPNRRQRKLAEQHVTKGTQKVFKTLCVQQKKRTPDDIIVSRRAVGLLLSDDGTGYPAHMRCYHSRFSTDIPCDCTHEKDENRFLLSKESEILEIKGKLIVDDFHLLVQKMMLVTKGDKPGSVFNPFSPLNPFNQSEIKEEEEEV